MSPSENTNTSQPAAPEPKKEGFFGKIAGLFKKKQSPVAVPPGFTSQTPEPRLDNMGADGSSAAIPGATPPQAAPLADVALAQTTTLPIADVQPVTQPAPVAPAAPAVAPLVDPLSPVPQPQAAPVAQPVVPPVPVTPAPVAPSVTPSAPVTGAVPSPFGPASAQPVQPQPVAPVAPPQPAPQFPPQQPPAPGV